MSELRPEAYGDRPAWRPQTPSLRPTRLILHWLIGAGAFLAAAAVLPGISIEGFLGALAVAAAVGILNAVLPPVIASLRLPYTVVVGFLLVLLVDAGIIWAASEVTERAITVSSFAAALLTAIVVSAVTIATEVVLGVNDDDAYTLRVTQRIARRQGGVQHTDSPGLLLLEIDGLAQPVLQRAMRDGNAPVMARWLAEGTHALAEWEPDLSSQTGASQCGILMGSNENIPAFRWVEKASGRLMTCSNPRDCEEIERRHSTGRGLLAGGGASRNNLLSGEADETILTVSRMQAERGANPGYQAFLANGFNVTRLLVLMLWDVALELVAAARQRRRDVRPRGARGGKYPLLRATVCVALRDLAVHSVLTDMMRGRPVVYSTFSGYDEVAHHSGLERQDTLETLRKIDQQIGRIERARRYAPRPYHVVVLSDHGQSQGATFLQRNGYGLDDLVRRALAQGGVADLSAGDENDAMAGLAVKEATGHQETAGQKTARGSVQGEDVVVLGSGNLGLVYLMHEPRRLTMEEIDRRHPRLLPAMREHPHIGFVMVRSAEHGAVALGARGAHYLAEGRVEGEDPLAAFSPRAPRHLLRSDGFTDAPDIYVNSFWDADLDEGCAFEELIAFHGGLGGSQTRPFILHPVELALPGDPVVGAGAVHDVLAGWRAALQGGRPAAGEVGVPADGGDGAVRPARVDGASATGGAAS